MAPSITHPRRMVLLPASSMLNNFQAAIKHLDEGATIVVMRRKQAWCKLVPVKKGRGPIRPHSSFFIGFFSGIGWAREEPFQISHQKVVIAQSLPLTTKEHREVEMILATDQREFDY